MIQIAPVNFSFRISYPKSYYFRFHIPKYFGTLALMDGVTLTNELRFPSTFFWPGVEQVVVKVTITTNFFVVGSLK